MSVEGFDPRGLAESGLMATSLAGALGSCARSCEAAAGPLFGTGAPALPAELKRTLILAIAAMRTAARVDVLASAERDAVLGLVRDYGAQVAELCREQAPLDELREIEDACDRAVELCEEALASPASY
jgi:hypothetical protein